MAWTYSDYVTHDYGATRLTRFRLHVQEVADKLSAEMSAMGRSYSTTGIQQYLDSLRKAEPEETQRCKLAGGDHVIFTRARPRPSP